MTTTFTISGDFDAARVEAMRPDLDALIDGENDVVLDLSGCRFIDSSGVGAMVFLHKRLRARGYRVNATGLHGQPLKLLRHLGIASLMSPIRDRAA